jgi:hypothetical protein
MEAALLDVSASLRTANDGMLTVKAQVRFLQIAWRNRL